jgi:hypothetical protein
MCSGNVRVETLMYPYKEYTRGIYPGIIPRGNVGNEVENKMTYDCIKVHLWRVVHQTFLPFYESERLGAVLFTSYIQLGRM